MSKCHSVTLYLSERDLMGTDNTDVKNVQELTLQLKGMYEG